MGRPPIIISNGGVIGVLAEGLQCTTKNKTVEDQLKDNVKKLDDSVAMIIINKNHQNDTPCLYWRLSNEPTYSKGPNKEGAAGINDIVDET